MKTTLLTLLGLILFSINKISAQSCSLSNLQFEAVYTGQDGKCYADVSFDMSHNNGNRYIYLHFWSAENFAKVDQDRFKSGTGPNSADINGTSSDLHPALATVAIDNSSSVPTWSSLNYRPDATVPVVKGTALQVTSSAGGNGSQGSFHFLVKGIPLGSLGGDCAAENIGMLVWSTQSNAAISQIHCAETFVQATAKLAISGFTNCATSSYTLRVTNKAANVVSGKIDMYGSKNTGSTNTTTVLSGAEKFDEVSYLLIEPNQTITINRPIPAKYLSYLLFSEFILSDNSSQVQQLLSASCGLLPVKMQSFTVSRAKQNVSVQWQTAMELNVQGFSVLRLTNGNEWKAVAYLPSKSAGGSSSQTLSYQFTDNNAYKGISQYRIQEVGTDGATSLSEIKMVRGEEQTTKLSLFPNPATNGKVSLVFDNASAREITITDMSGRNVRKLTNVTSSSVAVEGLVKGFYTVQVIDKTTGDLSIEKLIVQR